MPRLATLGTITGEVIRASKTTAIRYERDNPGDLGPHGRQEARPDSPGRRLDCPRAWSSSRHHSFRVGFDNVYSLIDDHSRFTYSEVLPDENGPTGVSFLERGSAEFAAHGIEAKELMTDNA